MSARIMLVPSTAPALVSARLTIRTAATVMTAGWPNPRKASLAGTTPATTATIKALKATQKSLEEVESSAEIRLDSIAPSAVEDVAAVLHEPLMPPGPG